MRMMTVDAVNTEAAIGAIEKIKTTYKQKHPSSGFFVFKLIDGGNVGQIIIMLGLDSFADYEKTENIQDDLLKAGGNDKAITGIVSETLIFKRDMSLNID
jgi:hypothetical protein